MSIRKMSSKLSQERAELDSLRVEEASPYNLPSAKAIFLAAAMIIMVIAGVTWLAVHRVRQTIPGQIISSDQSATTSTHVYTAQDYSPYPFTGTVDCTPPAQPEEAMELPHLPSGLIVVPDGFGAYPPHRNYGRIERYNVIILDQFIRGCGKGSK